MIVALGPFLHMVPAAFSRPASWACGLCSVHGFSLAECHQGNKGVFLLPVELCYHQRMWGVPVSSLFNWGFYLLISQYKASPINLLLTSLLFSWFYFKLNPARFGTLPLFVEFLILKDLPTGRVRSWVSQLLLELEHTSQTSPLMICSRGEYTVELRVTDFGVVQGQLTGVWESEAAEFLMAAFLAQVKMWASESWHTFLAT